MVKETWLCRYTRPAIITHDRGNELLGHVFKNDRTENKYEIKAKCATMENPQENSILEIIHQFMANLVRTFDVKNNYLDEGGLPLVRYISSYGLCGTKYVPYYSAKHVRPDNFWK